MRGCRQRSDEREEGRERRGRIRCAFNKERESIQRGSKRSRRAFEE